MFHFSKNRFQSIALSVMLLLLSVATSAHALSIRISQESSAGAGDFDSNILGAMTPFVTSLSASGFYQYGSPNAASYNGELNGGPTPLSSLSQIFLVDASDGLSLMMVHDKANDGSGGRTQTTWDLVGDTAAFVLSDDPGESLTVSAGGTHFESTKNWIACCTDGYAIGSLDNNWSMFGSFTTLPTGISAWSTVSSDFSKLDLTLAAGRRVRLDMAAPVPEPSTWILMGSGLLGLFFYQMRKRTRT